jgi:hypothetical protein
MLSKGFRLRLLFLHELVDEAGGAANPDVLPT